MFVFVLNLPSCGNYYAEKPVERNPQEKTEEDRENDFPTYGELEREILKPRCFECHAGENAEAGLNMNSKQSVLQRVIPGKPEESLLYERVADNSMPLGRPPLSPQQKQMIYTWILEESDQ